MNSISSTDMPSNIKQVAAMISGTAEVAFSFSARAISLRIPEHVLARIDAMAKLAGKSRNTMAVYLLEGAIEQVEESIDQPTMTRLNEAFEESCGAISSDTAERLSVQAS